MKTKKLLQLHLDKCEYIINITEDIEMKPKERLEISNPKTNPQFNLVKKGNKSRLFLSKIHNEKIEKLCQEEYLRKLRSKAIKRRKQLITLLNEFETDEFEEIYRNTHELKRKYIQPVTKIPERYREIWREQDFNTKPFLDTDRYVESEDGKKYRSKTERSLSQIFDSLGISYRYEAALSLGYRTIYPDFTFFSLEKMQEIYWEHFGRMDDPNYTRSVHKKIREYERHGIYLGDRLIVTFEDSQNDLDYSWARELINRFGLDNW